MLTKWMDKHCPLCKKEGYIIHIPEEWPNCSLCEDMKGNKTYDEWWKKYES